MLLDAPVRTVKLARQNVDLPRFLYKHRWTGSSEAEQEAFNLRVGISKFPRFTKHSSIFIRAAQDAYLKR